MDDTLDDVPSSFVVAIRFGSFNSGYAFSSNDDYEETSSVTVKANVWNSGRLSYQCHKMPTTLLLNPDQSFNSFGFDAENNYTDLVENGCHREYFYFPKFARNLYTPTTTITDSTGKKVSTKFVFSESIKFFNSCVGKLLSETGYSNMDVFYAFTIPPSWEETGIQFIIDAACEAGISSEQIFVALKPHIMELYCKDIVCSIRDRQLETESKWNPLDSCIVVDIGARRTEILVYEAEGALERKVIRPLGGLAADEEFRKLLEELWPGMVLDELQRESMADYNELYREFEMKKQLLVKGSPYKVSIPLPLALMGFVQNCTEGMTINQWLEKSPYPEIQLRRSQHLQLPFEMFQRLFNPTIDSVIQELKKLYGEPNLDNIDTILLTGGFAECVFLQDAILQHIPGKRLIVPVNPGFAVLQGSVAFGYAKLKEEEELEIEQPLKNLETGVISEEEKIIQTEEIPTPVEIPKPEVPPQSVVSEKLDVPPKPVDPPQPHVKTFSEQVAEAEKVIEIKPEKVKEVQQKMYQKFKYFEEGPKELPTESLEKGLKINDKTNTELCFIEVEKETETVDNEEINMMVLSAKNGLWNDVWKIFDKKPYIVNCIPEQRAWSALHQAIFLGNLEAVKKLVECYGADVSVMTKPDKAKAADPGTNAISLAEKMKKKEIFQYLIQHAVEYKNAINSQDISYFVLHKTGSVYPFAKYPLFQVTLASYKTMFVNDSSYKVQPSKHIFHTLEDVVSHSDETWEDAKIKIRSTLYGLDKGDADFLLEAKNKCEFFERVIKLYTREHVYNHLTPALIRQPRSPYKPLATDLAVGPFSLMLSSILLRWDNLQRCDKVTYRGVSSNVTDKYKPGDTFLFLHFVSSSVHESIADVFTKLTGTKFIFDNSTKTIFQPCRIENFSQFGYEGVSLSIGS